MNLDVKQLLNAGVHFGHLTRKKDIPIWFHIYFMEKMGLIF